MLTVEYRVNGQLIGFTNIKNIGPSEPIDKPSDLEGATFFYEFSHKLGETLKFFGIGLTGTMSGTVAHKRTDGFEVLVQKVLQKITKQK